MRIRRGDILWADLAPRSGSEQRGRRPVLVVSDDSLNGVSGWRSVVLVPLTESERQLDAPSSVFLTSVVTGLPYDSVALAHQVTTLDRAKLRTRVGALPAEEMVLVDDGLRAALGLY